MSRAEADGFTLLEVLVAMAIMAVAALALLSASQSQIRAVGALEDRTLAGMVAANKLTELELLGSVPDSGSSDDTVHLANRDWAVHSTFQPTPAPKVRRAVVEVGESGALFEQRQALVTLTGFIRLRGAGTSNASH